MKKFFEGVTPVGCDIPPHRACALEAGTDACRGCKWAHTAPVRRPLRRLATREAGIASVYGFQLARLESEGVARTARHPHSAELLPHLLDGYREGKLFFGLHPHNFRDY